MNDIKPKYRIVNKKQILELYPFLTEEKLKYMVRNRNTNGFSGVIVKFDKRSHMFDLDKFEKYIKDHTLK